MQAYSPPPPIVRSAADPLVTIGRRAGKPVTARFESTGDRGYLSFLIDGRFAGRAEIEAPANAVALLADTRFAPIWPAILAWAGADLVRLRDARLARARAAYEAGSTDRPGNMTQSTASPGTRRLLQYAEALRDSGQVGAARTLIESARAAIGRTSVAGRADWMALTVRLAGNAASDGDLPRAIALMDDGRAGLAADDPFAINFDVNRAAYLAEAGDHAAALALVERAEAAFDAARGDGTRVTGSDRQFGWIRACALAGLGRGDEARRAMAPVLRDEEPQQGGFVLAPTSGIQLRGFVCMDDAAGAARMLARRFDAFGVTEAALTLLQPAYVDPRLPAAFRRRVASEPVLVPLLAARMRPLSPALVPALNRWRMPG